MHAEHSPDLRVKYLERTGNLKASEFYLKHLKKTIGVLVACDIF